MGRYWRCNREAGADVTIQLWILALQHCDACTQAWGGAGDHVEKLRFLCSCTCKPLHGVCTRGAVFSRRSKLGQAVGTATAAAVAVVAPMAEEGSKAVGLPCNLHDARSTRVRQQRAFTASRVAWPRPCQLLHPDMVSRTSDVCADCLLFGFGRQRLLVATLMPKGVL